MTTSEQLESIPIQPIYRQAQSNELIDLGTSTVMLPEHAAPVTAAARLIFDPEPQLEIRVPTTTTSKKSLMERMFGDSNKTHTFDFVEGDKSIPAISLGLEEEKEILHSLRTPVAACRKATR